MITRLKPGTPAMYYVRADAAAQEPPYSDLEQMLECEAAIARYGLQQVGGRCDVVGPRTRWRDRPGLQELMQEARNGRYQALVIRSLDHLSRRGPELRVLLNDLAWAGVLLVSLREGVLQPAPIPNGDRQVGSPAGGVSVCERTAEGADPFSPLTIHPEDVPFVFGAYAAGASLDEIARTLDQRRSSRPSS